LKKADSPFLPDHPDDLLLQYLEHGLGAEESALVREHLDGCAQCRVQLEDLRRVVTVLQTEKQVFCPEMCSLYEFAVNDSDPEQILSKHVETCEACREEVEIIRAARERPERLDDEVWGQIQERLRSPVRPASPRVASEHDPAGFIQRFFTRFAVPKLAAAAAAAMILALVVFYPGEVIQPTVAVSSISWESSHKPKVPDATGRKRMALLILLKDFERPLPQKAIDNLYQALEPDMDINERYYLLTPAELKSVAKKLRFSEEGRKGSLDALRDRLGVAAVVLVTISPMEDKFSVQGEIRDTATDVVLARKRTEAVSSAELSDKNREIVRALLLQ